MNFEKIITDNFSNWKLLKNILKLDNNFKQFILELNKLYQNNLDLIPNKEDIFNAFKYTNFDNLKVIILGQDPYNKKEIATGLAFASNTITPPSLKNIFKNIIKSETKLISNNNLINLASQGVLLLNTKLFISPNKKINNKLKSNINFNHLLFNFLKEHKQNLVYILWGNDAIKYENLIDFKNNLIIKSTHPSPLCAYQKTKKLNCFFNIEFAKLTNEYLFKNKKEQIKW